MSARKVDANVTASIPIPFAQLGEGRSGKMVGFLRNQMPFILLIVLLIVGSFLSDVFLTVQNLLNVAWAVSVLGIIALGQVFLLITCNFDMSVAYTVGLAGILTVGAQVMGLGLIPSIMIGLLGGVLIGLFNGLLVVKTKANPFLITLGSGLLVFAISLTLTRSKTMYATIDAFNVIGRGKLFGLIHYPVIIFLVMAVVLEFVLRRTTFGRSLYILGLNEDAGRLSGIFTDRIKLLTFAFCGFMAAWAGIIMTARTNSTVANAGVGMDFDSIIAAVLGGSSLFGGRGGTLRTVVGVLVLGVMNNLLILLNVPYEAQQIAKGSVFLMVVWADSVLRVSN